MDHAEEQAQELEALEAILMDDLQGGFAPCSCTHTLALCQWSLPPPMVPPPARVGAPRHWFLCFMAMHADAEFEGTRPDGWDPSCACYSVVISPADDGASSPDPDELACAGWV